MLCSQSAVEVENTDQITSRKLSGSHGYVIHSHDYHVQRASVEGTASGDMRQTLYAIES
jgi:hypothetical protein